MKKLYLIILAVFLNIGLYSCTPTSANDEKPTEQACCDEGSNIPPPPPPTGNGD